MPPYPPRHGPLRLAGAILSLCACVLLILDQLLPALVLVIPIVLVATAVDRKDRPVEEEMTDLLMERAWVMLPDARREAYEQWDDRFGAVRKPSEVRSALEAMPGGMSAVEERSRRITGGGLLKAAGFVMGILLLLSGVGGLAGGHPVPASSVAVGSGVLMLVSSLGARSDSSAHD